MGGAAAIAQTGIAGGQQAAAYAVFAVIASIGVAVPVVIYFAMGKRSADLLAEMKDWIGRNNAAIMSDSDAFDLNMATYQSTGTAQQDFDALVQAAKDKTVKSENVILAGGLLSKGRIRREERRQ